MDFNESLLLSGNDTNATKHFYDKRKEAFVHSAGFLCSVLFVAVVFREYLKKFNFPYAVMLFIYGGILGLLSKRFSFFHDFTRFAQSGIVIQLFLPVIIFDYSFGINPHMFIKAVNQCIVLAVFGFAVSAAFIAVFAKLVFTNYKWDWLVCIIFGAILSATDPSAVLEILKDHSVAPNIITIMEGEAMLNSGMAFLISKIILNVFDGETWTVEGIILYLIQNCLGAVILGYVIAAIIIAILRKTNNDTDMEVTFTLTVAYILYFVSEAFLDISGIVAVVVFGVSLSSYKSSTNYDEEETTVHQFWQTLSFWANSLIFAIVGVLIISNAFKDFESSDIGFIIASYYMSCLCRGCMMIILTPLLKNCGYGFTCEYGMILTWGGMRGAVGLALALLTRHTQKSEIVGKLLIQISGVIVMTLIFNASTMHWLLQFLGIGQITHKNVESMAHTISLLRDSVQTTEKVIRMDKFLAGADWAWVHKVTQIENPYEKKGSAFSAMMKRAFENFRGRCKKCDAEIRIEPNLAERTQMESESRLLILRALRTSVSNQHESYGILRRSLGHLDTFIENAINTPDKILLAEDVMRTFLKTSYYFKSLQKYMMRRCEFEKDKENQELSLMEEPDTSAFRKKCIKIHYSKKLDKVMLWISLTNIIPVVAEYVFLFTKYRPASDNILRAEILISEIINGVLAFFYIFEAVVKIGALGGKRYFRSKGNIIDFIVTVTAAIQMIYGIILISAFKYSFTREHLYVLVGLTSVRILRLLRIIIYGIFSNILNQFCSAIYNAFDLAIGFIVANEEVAKSAHKIIEYEEFAESFNVALENNIYKMLCYTNKIEEEHPNVVCAWRTHRATIYILRNMKEFIEEMVHVFMIDESDAEHLLEKIELKMNETLSETRYMKADEGIRNVLKNIYWIKNDQMLEEIAEKYSIKFYSKNDVIQEIGEHHTDIKILYKGIVKVSGTNTEEKDVALPNTDTLNYFYVKGNFITYVDPPQTLGLLGYLLQTPSVTRVDSLNYTEVISISFKTISDIEERFGSLSFQMWKPLALEVAFAVLKDKQTYENWSDEKLKIILEEAIFPNLEDCFEFEVHPVIVDMVLIQGKVIDKETHVVYIGPTYIPHSVRSLQIPGDPNQRPRVVMVCLREEKFHSCSVKDWTETDEIRHIGLCLIHGIKKISSMQQMNENFVLRQSIIQTLGRLLKPKSEHILESDSF